jgi:hypothetical protein
LPSNISLTLPLIYDGDANNQFTVKVANTMDEAIKLMEFGFEFNAEIEGNNYLGSKNR